jgi:hypothetical protein
MCSPFNPASCAAIIDALLDVPGAVVQNAAEDTVSAMLAGLNTQLHAGIKAMMIVLAGWLLVPSTDVCPGGGQPGTSWTATCNTAASPAAQLRSWMLPVTILVAVLGLLWQAIALTITRKGEPLIQAMRGLATTALWGAVGIVGTQLALRASDSYTFWILKQAVFGDSANPVDTLGTALADMSPVESYNALILLILFNLPILFISLVQIILMIFREGSVVILAGLLQLAAAGSFTRLTSAWLPKVTGWMLALICYKPIAASVYATAFALMGNEGMRNSIMGLAVLLLAIVAMPATMKFFNWTVGSLASSASTLGMLGTVAAAGVHAASSLRGVGGYHVGDHATYMDDHGPGSAGRGSRPGAGPTGGGPGGSGGGWPTGPGPITPPSQAGAGGAGTATGASAGGAGTAAGAGASAAAGAATGGATLAAQAGVEAIGKVKQAGQDAVNTAGDAMQAR